MPSLTFVIFICVLVCIESILGQTSCETTTELGRIAESQKLARLIKFNKCWTIKVPAEKYAKIEVTTLTVVKPELSNVTLTIGQQTLKPPQTRFPTFSLTDVNITFYAENTRYPAVITVELELNYQVESLTCAQPNAFRCNETECIPQSQVCNGVRNCGNGADENDCDGENESANVNESREKTLQFLKSLEFRRGGWGDDTPQVLTAIHLANSTNFNVNIEDRLVAAKLEIQISTNDNPSNKQRAQYINALQAICSEPNSFYGKTLVKDLDDKIIVENYSDDSDGLAYLALCNAKINLNGQIDKIKTLLKAEGNFDEKKYNSALTIACMNRQANKDPTIVDPAMQDLKTVVDRLKGLQKRDGSFDTSVTVSAWILQTIMASNITDGDWSYQDAIGYLVKEMGKQTKDIPPMVATLPLLANKTLIDIKCNGGSRKGLDEFMMTDIKDLILWYNTLDVKNEDDAANKK